MLFYRSKKFERDVQTNRWKINFEDISFTRRTQSHSKVRIDVSVVEEAACLSYVRSVRVWRGTD